MQCAEAFKRKKDNKIRYTSNPNPNSYPNPNLNPNPNSNPNPNPDLAIPG